MPFFPKAIRCTECPDGWLQAEDQCFFLNTERQDFSTCAAKCKDISAHLAILTTKEQLASVFLFFLYFFFTFYLQMYCFCFGF